MAGPAGGKGKGAARRIALTIAHLFLGNERTQVRHDVEHLTALVLQVDSTIRGPLPQIDFDKL
jgi:hypothetical protein